MVPSLETAPEAFELNGLTALITSGSLLMLVTDWLIAAESDVSVPCREWKTIWPEYPPWLAKVSFSRLSPLSEGVPGTL